MLTKKELRAALERTLEIAEEGFSGPAAVHLKRILKSLPDEDSECGGAGLSWKLDPDFPGRAWLGGAERCTSLGGVYVHTFALRVRDVPVPSADAIESEGSVQMVSSGMFQEELENLQAINGGRLQASRLEGLEGEWVVCAHSLGDC